MQLKTMSSLVLALALVGGSSALFAQGMSSTGKPLTAQQTKMKSCNADAKAKSLKGAERKTFMSSCLKGDGAMAAAPATAAAAPMSHDAMAAAPAAAPMAASTPATAKETQQEKMKTCNANAKSEALKGAARKSFMKTCLSGDAAAH